MSHKKQFFYSILGIILTGIIYPIYSQEEIKIYIGEHKTITVPPIEEVYESEGIKARYIPGGREVVVTGVSEGPASLTIYTRDGRTITKNILVIERKIELPAMKRELEELLRDIVTNFRCKVVGDRLIIEGRIFEQTKKEKFDKIIAKYPEVINLVEVEARERLVKISAIVIEAEEGGEKSLTLSLQRFLAAAEAKVEIERIPLPSLIEGEVEGGVVSFAFPFAAISSAINNLLETRKAKVIASPEVVTINGKTAKLLSGGEVPYSVVGPAGYPSVEWREYGVKIEVTPEIRPTEIFMKLHVEAGEPIRTEFGPSISKRSIDFEIALEPGKSVVIGGLKHQFKSTAYGCGCLLPHIGIRHGTQWKELLVIVTPTVGETIERLDYRIGKEE